MSCSCLYCTLNTFKIKLIAFQLHPPADACSYSTRAALCAIVQLLSLRADDVHISRIRLEMRVPERVRECDDV